MTQTFELTRTEHRSGVLDSWLASREGAQVRAGQVQALSENGTMDGMSMQDLVGLLGASFRSASGENVTTESAARVSAVYSCVSLIAGAIATLPLGFYERAEEGRGKASHPYWWFFNESACDGWTSAVAIEYLFNSKFFYGDGFGEILRSRNGNQVAGWKPLHPLTVDPFKKDGRVLYRIQPSDKPAYVLQPEDVIHLPSLGFDGLRSQA